MSARWWTWSSVYTVQHRTRTNAMNLQTCFWESLIKLIVFQSAAVEGNVGLIGSILLPSKTAMPAGLDPGLLTCDVLQGILKSSNLLLAKAPKTVESEVNEEKRSRWLRSWASKTRSGLWVYRIRCSNGNDLPNPMRICWAVLTMLAKPRRGVHCWNRGKYGVVRQKRRVDVKSRTRILISKKTCCCQLNANSLEAVPTQQNRYDLWSRIIG